nr:MAG TPA: hypothetical protein [Caudoviricetes sp.]DAL95965.1 MAG TPA: hypothetical protein [Caudoviricetes sp.]
MREPRAICFLQLPQPREGARSMTGAFLYVKKR